MRPLGAKRLGKLHRAGRRALAACPLKVAVLDQQKLVLADLVAPALCLINRPLPRSRSHEFVPEAMTGKPVDLPERHSLGRRGR